ncbi:glycosyltransferase family 4 protein [Pseudomonas cichorii]|uniref:Glycosyltransferase family 4 protein n=1 Tax=Pseudomonas lijiangensis TaxID=2995658 RepID=A0ABX8HM09_9PSED|nr:MULTISPECIES: glycosyltransferase family 4 protein [Pseudomonas syringae group]MBX8491358.1 glycosyltransferase family 4 protein [Pseudomonas cichorii]MBX8499527.1 glycosyltransferase family 4 protein [Pseudomonas lijiangensis]MBX8505353.1 glycosyltransferase family 4 protein [Pseudomonas lijiangensis]MBX8508443.1 glycosyltransferase family 4 protein [Pseudomonas cichorii]MBX8519842.1 glycosyltransferase family 4 protein [Pseudomonas cichorii]
MRILWTLPYLPWPTTSGGKTREYHLLRNLAARGHRITLLVQSKTPLDDACRSALEPWLERLIVIDRRPLLSLRTLLAVAFAPPPMLASVNGYAPKLEQTFEKLLEEDWDIIQLQHTYAFQPFEGPLKRSGKPFVLTEHNVESALGAASYDRLPRWASFFAVYDRWRYRRWELRVFRQTSELVAVTEEDAKVLSRLSGRATSIAVNSVDCSYYANVHADRYNRRLLFIGNYEYGPNVDAIEWALDEIMPLVWELSPTVRFAVGGFGMPESWRERWPDQRIEWLGFVPDLRALQSSSSMFFAPLRQGGGSKLKILESMAAGLPVVTTGQGVSGLDVTHGEHYLGSEEPAQLARLIADNIDSPARLIQIGEAGRAYVRSRHDWSVSAAQLEGIYTRISPPSKDLAHAYRT